jgi:hypothetical protein
MAADTAHARKPATLRRLTTMRWGDKCT